MSWVLSHIDLSACKGAGVDDEPQFFGRPVPGTNLLVGNLTSLDTCSGHPFLLCLNPIYHASVKTKIRERFPEAKVFGVTPEGVCLLE